MEPISIDLHQRYLVPFHPKLVPHAFTDVVIIGAGIAGIRAALEVDPRLQVVLITKDKLPQSNSAYAQGGIAGVMDPTDSIADHVADTMAAGKGMCDETVVQSVVEEAPARIQDLIDYGAHFDLEDGEIALTKEGGHSHARIAHALGDATGKEIMRALREKVRQASNVQIWESTFTIDLLTYEEECRGAIVWNPRHGKTLVWAKQTILATGGAGCLYRETTNPDIATADGHAMAFRAGAELRDMEFVQFHPTVLYIPGSTRHLISEAVRGEGAYLRDCHGKRFMPDYDSQEELAPRDVVSRSITQQMALTNHPCVYLDLSHIERERVQERFPHISKVCDDFGLDLAKDLIPVRPGAHYMIGGLTVNEVGQTTLPNLWAAGEATSTGLHGGNRLGSNSLLEGLVFGRHAGQGVSAAALKEEDRFAAPYLEAMPPDHHPEEDELNIVDLRNSLSSIMWRLVGIERDEEGLQEAQRQVEFWTRYVSHHVFDSPEGWELQNLMLAARLVITAASERKESRGVHNRSDFPETDADQERHIRLLAK